MCSGDSGVRDRWFETQPYLLITTSLEIVTMLVAYFSLALLLFPELAWAGLLPSWVALDRREDICGATGFANSDNNYFWSNNRALTTYAGCSTRCSGDARCKSFGYSDNLCILFDKTLSASLAQYSQSDIVYFDIECLGGNQDGATISQKPASEIFLLRSTRRATVTHTRTISKVGPLALPVGSATLSARPLGPGQTGAQLSDDQQPTVQPDSASSSNGKEAPRAFLEEAGHKTDPASASTIITIITPLSQSDTPIPTLEVGHQTSGQGTLAVPTAFLRPHPTAVVPQIGHRNGSTRICRGGDQPGDAPWGSHTWKPWKPKRWVWSWPGFGSSGPKWPHNSTWPAGAPGCYPRSGFRFLN